MTMSLPSSSLRGLAATIVALRGEDVDICRRCDARGDGKFLDGETRATDALLA